MSDKDATARSPRTAAGRALPAALDTGEEQARAALAAPAGSPVAAALDADAIRRSFLDELIATGVVIHPMSYNEIREVTARVEKRWAGLAASPCKVCEHEWETIRTGPESEGYGHCVRCGTLWTLAASPSAAPLDVERLRAAIREVYGRLPGTWELRSENPRDITGIPIEQLSWWELIWVYRCSGCGKDRRSGGFFLVGYGAE